MKLSVIITSYKFKEYITNCIDGVLSQNTDFEFEILVRDDGTNDGTYEMLCETYASRPNVKILDSSVNVGASENFLTLINKSTGEYIAHIDGDDYFTDTNYFKRAIKFLDENNAYSLYCSGCRYLENEKLYPENGWILSAKSDFELSDLLVENYASFGRIFRKTEFKKETFENIPYPDWGFNFEIIKKGRGYCETGYCAGIYRIHSGGMYSTTSEEKKLENKLLIRKELSKRYETFKIKTITIVDSFVYNDTIKNKLKNCVEWLKNDGHEVLLVSNTIVGEEILKNVKFYIYDNRNQLFDENYEIGSVVDFWQIYDDDFQLHNVVPETQKHGLSVLINLFNALSYAKQQGYTHFQRFEVDDLYGEKSREHIKNVPSICIQNKKEGLFYYNEDRSPKDISFHYFYSNIDLFLEKIKRISKEQDYVDYLKSFYGNKAFKIVEAFIYDNLKKNGDEEFIKKYGMKEMALDFPDTNWNTETSITSIDSKYGKCVTKLYSVNEFNKETNAYYKGSTYILHTKSYVSELVNRRIEVEKNNGEKFNLFHSTAILGAWTWHELASDIKSVSVYENETFLYKEYASECISYANIKRK